MQTITVNLNSIEKVKKFVNTMSSSGADGDLYTTGHRYAVDAKSIMGVLSLDLSKNLNLKINGTSEEEHKLINELKSFIVK